jgi:hypothetical protein
MQELDAVEARQLEAILSGLPPAHPAREARRRGLSLIDIAHCAGPQEPEVVRSLLDLYVQRRRLSH